MKRFLSSPHAVMRAGILAGLVLSLGTVATGCPTSDGDVDAGPGVEPSTNPDGGPGVEPDGGPGPNDGGPGPGVEPDGGPGPGVEPGVEPPVVTECANTPVAQTDPGANVCAVEVGAGTSTLIVGDILTPNEVFRGGAVLVDNAGEIQCTGCDCAAQAADATLVICPDAVVSPGLINAHDHMGWMNDGPWYGDSRNDDIPDALRWEHRHDWRRGGRGQPSISTSGGANGDAKARGELRFSLSGATSTFGSGSEGGMLRNLDSFNPATLSGLGISAARYQTFPLGDSNGTLRSAGCAYGDIDQPSAKNGFGAYVPHVSEGIDIEARNEFLCLTGQGDGSVDLLGENTAIIHGVGLIAPDVARMASSGIGLVWSPRTNVSLYGETAMATAMARAGVNIGLGTDWMPSGSMSMLRELACVDELNRNNYGNYFLDRDIWAMATIGSARALGVSSRIGALAPGYVADIAIFAKNGRTDYRAVIDANPGDVALVMRAGEVLNGNTSVVDALESGCDSVGDVCGTTKSTCINLPREVGKALSAIEAGANSSYPLFACDVPVDEPSCVPARTLEGDVVDGSNLYDGVSRVDDQDGDGILDADDNCPTIFNAIRPVDDGAQADFDNDDLGDACDPCPLDANTTDCEVFNPNDSDGDGTDDTDDNCPSIPNEDQADADSDNKGDLCDACPNDANPGAAGCPATIPDVKQGVASEGAVVSLSDVIVTAVLDNGFFVQSNVDPAPDFGGVFVYSPNEQPPRGTIIDMSSATVANFFGQIQLNNVLITETGTGVLPTPRVLSPADVVTAVTDGAASAVEGMLVEVLDIAVTNDAPTPGDADDATNEVEVTGGLRIDDAGWTEATYLDPIPATGEVLARVTGPAAFRNGLVKLLPRDSDDVVFDVSALEGFNMTEAFLREGDSNAPSIGVALEVRLRRVSDIQTTVSLESSNPAVLTVSDVTIPALSRTGIVFMNGLSAGTVTVNASLGADAFDAQVRVVGAAEQPQVVSVTPPTFTALVGTAVPLAVTLDFPAPAGGIVVDLASSDASVTVPAQVTVGADTLSATFDANAISVGAADVTASFNGTDATSTITVADLVEVDVSGFVVAQANGSASFTLPPNTTIPSDGYLVIGRDATKAAFEEHWGELGSNVTYVNAGGSFLVINATPRTYAIGNGGAQIDGPTIETSTPTNYQRNVPVGAAGDAASWALSPEADATPGSGQTVGAGDAGLYISEISDATGTGNFIYEFIELYYDGAPL